VICHDPLVTRWPELDVPVVTDIPSLDGVDALVFAVPHQEYAALDLPDWLDGARPVVLDANAVLSDTQRRLLREIGCRVGSIGRGTGV
jgi:UDP-N-acetyl-D-glucosamine dehydrogenase